MTKKPRAHFRYTFRIEFRNGGQRESFSTATRQADARRDVWTGLDCDGLDPQRTVRRIDLVSKTPTTPTGPEDVAR